MTRNRGIRFWTRPTAVFFALLLLLVPISLLAQDQDPGQTTDEKELSAAEKIDLAQQGEEILARLEILIAQGGCTRKNWRLPVRKTVWFSCFNWRRPVTVFWRPWGSWPMSSPPRKVMTLTD